MPVSTTGAAAPGASASPKRSAAASRTAKSELIDAENRYQAIHDDTVLPQGVIHGDYFHDNVLWDDEGAAGVIDFYFACDDALAYDVAIGVNDWCVTPTHASTRRARAPSSKATRSRRRSPISSATSGR
jgi:homoserine kinase type II